MAIVVAVLGYGAPEDPVFNDHYLVYLDAAAREMRLTPGLEAILLVGGLTTRKDLSEARAMQVWFESHEPRVAALPTRLLERSITTRENVEELREHSRADDEMVIFCEYSRRWRVRLLARHLLRGRGVRVIGVKFDEACLERRHRLLQAGPVLLAEWLRLHSPVLEHGYHTWRARGLPARRARQAAASSRSI